MRNILTKIVAVAFCMAIQESLGIYRFDGPFTKFESKTYGINLEGKYPRPISRSASEAGFRVVGGLFPRPASEAEVRVVGGLFPRPASEAEVRVVGGLFPRPASETEVKVVGDYPRDQPRKQK